MSVVLCVNGSTVHLLASTRLIQKVLAPSSILCYYVVHNPYIVINIHTSREYTTCIYLSEIKN